MTTAERSKPAVFDEERLNAATHGMGLALALVGSAVLLTLAWRHGSAAQAWACAAYATTLVSTYGASTLSHVFQSPRLNHALRIADQALIFLFIAGTYTPVAVSWLHGPWWGTLTGVMWGVAVGGFASKAIFSHRVRLGTVSTVLYVLLGWLPMAAGWPMFNAVPHALMYWLWAGGGCYMIGMMFFRYDDRIRFFHAAWHLLVMAGSACHFVGILLFCTGRTAGA